MLTISLEKGKALSIVFSLETAIEVSQPKFYRGTIEEASTPSGLKDVEVAPYKMVVAIRIMRVGANLGHDQISSSLSHACKDCLCSVFIWLVHIISTCLCDG